MISLVCLFLALAPSFLQVVLALVNPNGDIQRRQSVPMSLPSNWTSQGCYTDTSSARTLAAATFTSTDSMTVESCIAFCTTGEYIYAGVEFGQECYCDYAIQNPGVPTSLSDCDSPCTGNSSESCGAANRLNLYFSGAAGPTVPQTIQAGTSNWTYKGCYTDNTSSRTLPTTETITGGVTAEACVNACQSAGFLYAGLEFADECWCGNSTGTATLAPDSDCHMACAGNHSEFCGGSNRLTVYGNISPGVIPPQICVSSDMARFNPQAVYKQPQASGSLTAPISMINTLTIPLVSYGIFSDCASCGGWEFYALQDGVILPKGAIPFPAPVSLTLNAGESPSFVSTQFPPPPFPGYCTMANPTGGPSLLAGSNRSDLWSLCPNTTAGGRLDIVWSPRPNHPHYVLTNCQAVDIELIPA